MFRFCSLFALILLWAPSAWANGFSGEVRIIDGDTIDVGKIRVRLHGIDAPERNQPCVTLEGQNWSCGDWLTHQLRSRVEGSLVRCDQTDLDRYGRVVARCFAGGQDIGRALVAQGLAFAYRKYSTDYVSEERAAQRADLGLHRYTVQSPARYRLAGTNRTAAEPACRIKGNISRQGVRIYHMPGQAFYDRTGIRLAQGEQWFCSEAQAPASGWRKAKR